MFKLRKPSFGYFLSTIHAPERENTEVEKEPGKARMLWSQRALRCLCQARLLFIRKLSAAKTLNGPTEKDVGLPLLSLCAKIPQQYVQDERKNMCNLGSRQESGVEGRGNFSSDMGRRH